MAYIIADARERYVIPALQSKLGDRLVTEQIHTGDYLLCRRSAGGEPEIVAVFERKTAGDFLSSLSDGRYNDSKHTQRGKMLQMRDACGCQLYYIIESNTTISKDARGGKYAAIATAMITLPLANGIHVVQTKNEEATAQLLCDYCTSLDKISSPYQYPMSEAAAAAPTLAEGAAQAVPACVSGSYEVPDSELMLNIWSSLPGIASVSARVLLGSSSLRQLAEGKTNPGELRTPTNRAFPKKAQTTLRKIIEGDISLDIKLLAAFPGLSTKTAAEILEQTPRGAGSRLQYLTEEALDTVELVQKSRKVRLGKRKATILKFLTFTEAQPTTLDQAQPTTPDQAQSTD